MLYDVGLASRSRRHPRRGVVSVPQPFWVVRTLALRPRCEFLEGCEKTAISSELTVALRHEKGDANPSNLTVTCIEHHPWGSDRLVSNSGS
ncbi:hypothetical protein [Demequina rhizosphaerae]|uniref:hypothetical protein n=1 Tax=Demequina rhizosphaerae TaxID=1638985 RepID=UPI001E54F8DA|nr:hypothetical protein [Demequina rhizosphaerae]